MSNYLKKILFTLLILGIPCMNSVSKAMNSEDYEGSNVRARTVSFVVEDQQNSQSFTKHSTHSQVVSLEDSKISWTSYLSSSVMSAAQKTYDIVDYTTRNPQKAAIIGVFMAYQVADVVATHCCCWCSNGIFDTRNLPNKTACAISCKEINETFYRCNPCVYDCEDIWRCD